MGKFTLDGKRDHDGRVSDIRRRKEKDGDMKHNKKTINSACNDITSGRCNENAMTVIEGDDHCCRSDVTHLSCIARDIICM